MDLVEQLVCEIDEEANSDPMGEQPTALDADRVFAILSQPKSLAHDYCALTGRPLGVTGEVAEYEAALLLGLELTPVPDPWVQRNARLRRPKGRHLLSGSKPWQRIETIDVKKAFDAVLLMVTDEHLRRSEIYEADRAAAVAALTKPGSRSRNERGAYSRRLSAGTSDNDR